MLISGIVSGFAGSSLMANEALNRDIDRYKDLFRNQPEVKREIDYFRENIGKVESVDALVKDYRLLKTTLSAFGLEDQQFAKAMIKRVIEEGTNDKKDLANQFVDPRYKELAEAFNYPKNGLGMTQEPLWVSSIINKFVDNEFEKEVGAANENLRMAMYFERKAPKMTSWYQILGDKALYQVALKMAGLPKEAAQMDIDKQVELFKEKIPLKEFRDPEKLDKHINTFLVRADAEQNAALSNPTVQLMQGAAQMTGFSPIVSLDPTLFLGMK